MQALRILKHHSRYNPGEIAGFAPDEAARLIAAGLAEAYVAEPAEPQPAQPGLPLGEGEAPALADLKKAELVALAKDELGLDLDPDLKKDELIAAIEAARAEKAKA